MNYSFSQLDMFQHCQKQYMYEYVQKEERRFFQSAFDGTIVHKFLEQLYGLPWEDVVNLVIEQYGMYDRVQNISDELKRVVTPNFFQYTLEVEHKLNFDVGDYSFIGYIDRLDRKDNMFEIVDYKYGSYEYSQYNLSHSLQVDLYSLGIMSLHHVDSVLFTYHNVRQNTKFTRKVDKNSIDVGNIISLIKAIENAREKKYFPPQVSNLCAYCFYNQRCEDYKSWMANDLKLTPDANMDTIIDTIITFGNKRKAYENAEKKLKLFVHNYMDSQGLREWKGNNKQVIPNKDSVLVKVNNGRF